MDPNTAATAQELTNPGVDDMGAGMSDAELEAFVDSTLGNKVAKAPAVVAKTEEAKDELPKDDKAVKPTDPKKIETGEDGKPVDDKTPKPEDLVEPAKQEEEVKPVDIPAVDLSDLFIEIEAYIVDDKGENPQEQTIRLKVGETLPDTARFKSDAQLYEVLEAQQEMRKIRDERNAEYEEKKATEDTKKSEITARDEQMTGWDAEIAELIEDGDLEAPKVKPGETGFLEDPTTKTIDEVFKFMKTENEKRLADKKPLIRSFQVAFNKYNKQADVAAQAKKEADETALLKQRGALVGGGNPGGGSGAGDSSHMYVAGSAKTIHQVDTSDL